MRYSFALSAVVLFCCVSLVHGLTLSNELLNKVSEGPVSVLVTRQPLAATSLLSLTDRDSLLYEWHQSSATLALQQQDEEWDISTSDAFSLALKNHLQAIQWRTLERCRRVPRDWSLQRVQEEDEALSVLQGFYVYEMQVNTAFETVWQWRRELQEWGIVLEENGYFDVSQSWHITVPSVQALLQLQQLSNIASIEWDRPFSIPHGLPQPEQVFSSLTFEDDSAPAVEWNVVKVKADKVWNLSRGQGTVYANADTGVDWQHPALTANYLGVQSDGSVVHDYAWWDAIKKPTQSGTGKCGINSSAPCDDNGHGTHTTSTTVGQQGLGVAPDSRWMACRNMDRGVGSPSTYLGCLQFFYAPTRLDGTQANPALRPHAVGNSYGCPTQEGCARNAFHAAVKTLREAGIFMAVSAGNEGPRCRTIAAPPGTEPLVTSVGAVSRQNSIASFSSRGPVLVNEDDDTVLDLSKNGTRLITKPEISCPGVGVRGAWPGGSFASLSGTSMASPHLGGAILLLSTLCPKLSRQVDALRDLLTSTALPLKTRETCGSDTPQSIPNNVFGYGLMDIENAVASCRGKTMPKESMFVVQL